MANSCFLGKVLLAFGICLVLLSIGAFVDQAQANCDVCLAMPCGPQPLDFCGAGECQGIFCTGDCACQFPLPETPQNCRCREWAGF